MHGSPGLMWLPGGRLAACPMSSEERPMYRQNPATRLDAEIHGPPPGLPVARESRQRSWPTGVTG